MEEDEQAVKKNIGCHLCTNGGGDLDYSFGGDIGEFPWPERKYKKYREL